jgi:hypothetical protein
MNTPLSFCYLLKYTRQQELEYLYQYSFYPSKFYGDPGLEFIETNIQAIDK